MSSWDVNFVAEGADYESAFEDDGPTTTTTSTTTSTRALLAQKRRDLAVKERPKKEPKATNAVFREEASRDEGRRIRAQVLSLSAYDRHKKLVNDYILYFPGSTARLERDTSNDRRDIDVIRANHKFLWDGDEDKRPEELTWGQQLAKKYYEKLFKEYCICDVSRYKANQVAMRWRTEAEVMSGKGQFVCGARKCEEKEILRTWEANFAYVEQGERKNALVKVRLCPDCSYKLNYFHKKKEVTKAKQRQQKSQKKRRRHASSEEDEGLSAEERILREKKRKLEAEASEKKAAQSAAEIWSAPVEVEQEKSREEDFSEFLEDLFL